MQSINIIKQCNQAIHPIHRYIDISIYSYSIILSYLPWYKQGTRHLDLNEISLLTYLGKGIPYGIWDIQIPDKPSVPYSLPFREEKRSVRYLPYMSSKRTWKDFWIY